MILLAGFGGFCVGAIVTYLVLGFVVIDGMSERNEG